MFGTHEPKLQPLSPELRGWAASVADHVSPTRLRSDVEAMPAPRNRLHSPEAMARADDLIIQGFQQAGWLAERRPFEFTRVVGYLDYPDRGFEAGAAPKIYRRLAGVNLLAVKEGQSSRDVILVGAHHDTIRDSPGADDNTASVAALMEVARVIAPYTFRDTIMLAALDMEEINYFGSKALVPELSRERRIKGAIIYESMAYTSTEPHSQTVPARTGIFYRQQARRIKLRNFVGDWAVIVYRKSAVQLAQAIAGGLAHLAGPDKVILMRDPSDLSLSRILSYLSPPADDFARSDHIVFWEHDIPAIMISDTANFRNPHYHQPTDTPDTLDYEHLAKIVGATAIALAQIAGVIK